MIFQPRYLGGVLHCCAFEFCPLDEYMAQVYQVCDACDKARN